MFRNMISALFALTLIAAPAVAQDANPAVSAAPAATQDKLTVFAAASLKNALDEVNAAWTAANAGKAVTASYAGSNALAKQIGEGAPADVFISADLAWMDDVDGKKLIKEGSRSNLLGNSIVLVAPSDSTAEVKLAQGVDIAAALKGGKLAMANVDAVPAGKYGKAALEKLGSWDGVKDHVAQAENVRAALLLVSRGEAPLGIVYKTDAAADKGVKIIDTFPAETHAPIVYPVGVVAASKNADTDAYVAFLKTPAVSAIFEKHGFTVPN